MSMVSLIVNFVPIILAIVLHELAHGYAAYRLGDNTAKICGRLTLNPLKHVDLFGTILLPALLYFSQAGFMFGWAKPVPVNFNNLRRSKRDLIIVASAGIVTNLALAVVSAVLLKFISILPQSTAQGVIGLFLLNMVVFNVVLAIFNALPIPPLDGSHVLECVMGRHLPHNIRDFMHRYGKYILVALLWLGVLQYPLNWAQNLVYNWILRLL